MNKDVKLTPFTNIDPEGNLCGGLFIEDDESDVVKYEYMFLSKNRTKEEFMEFLKEDYKKNGLLNFKRY